MEDETAWGVCKGYGEETEICDRGLCQYCLETMYESEIFKKEES